MSFGFVWVARTSVAGRTIVESRVKSGVNRFSCRSKRSIMYTLTRGSLSTGRKHVPPAQMSRFQILNPAPISGSDSPEVRRNLSPSQKRKDGRGKRGMLWCADGGRGVADGRRIGGIAPCQAVFFGKSLPRRRGSCSHEGTDRRDLPPPSRRDRFL